MQEVAQRPQHCLLRIPEVRAQLLLACTAPCTSDRHRRRAASTPPPRLDDVTSIWGHAGEAQRGALAGAPSKTLANRPSTWPSSRRGRLRGDSPNAPTSAASSSSRLRLCRLPAALLPAPLTACPSASRAASAPPSAATTAWLWWSNRPAASAQGGCARARSGQVRRPPERSA